MLAQEKPAMALVTMEARLAPPAISAALDAGCHVMAEKPSCVQVEDFEKLAQQADASERHLMLALANRLNPEVQEARRLIQEGKLGKIYGLELHLVADQTRLTRPSYPRPLVREQRTGRGRAPHLAGHSLAGPGNVPDRFPHR